MKIKFHAIDISLILTIFTYAASATITPICLIAMSQELGFSLFEGGGIEGIRSFLIFLSLFLSGFFAARFNKMHSLSWGLIFLSIGFFMFALAPSYGLIIIAAMLMGFSSGILEGLINPAVQDLHPTNSGQFLNITNAFWSVGVFITVILGGDLITRGISWRILPLFFACLTLFAGVFMLIMSKKHLVALTLLKTIKKSTVFVDYILCIKSRRFWIFCLMMLLAGGSEGAFTFWSASYIQINLGGGARLAGFGTAFFAAGMMTMRFLGGFFVGQNKLRRFILSSAFFGIIISAIAPFIVSKAVFFVALFCAGLSIACFWPSIQSYAVHRLPFLDSTAAFILMSCAGMPGWGIVSFTMGYLGDRYGFQKAFFLVPFLLATLAIIVIIERNYFKNQKKEVCHE